MKKGLNINIHRVDNGLIVSTSMDDKEAVHVFDADEGARCFALDVVNQVFGGGEDTTKKPVKEILEEPAAEKPTLPSGAELPDGVPPPTPSSLTKDEAAPVKPKAKAPVNDPAELDLKDLTGMTDMLAANPELEDAANTRKAWVLDAYARNDRDAIRSELQQAKDKGLLEEGEINKRWSTKRIAIMLWRTIQLAMISHVEAESPTAGPAAKPAAEPVVAPAADPLSVAPQVTLEELAARMQQTAALGAGAREKVLGLLTARGVSRVNDLPESEYAGILVQLDVVTEAHNNG